MLWVHPQTLPLTWVEIASKAPPESGVFAIMDQNQCVLVGESWNLRARLLDMVKAVQEIGEFTAIIDLCPEKNRVERRDQLIAALLRKTEPVSPADVADSSASPFVQSASPFC